MAFKTFEELPVWIEARKLSRAVYTMSRQKPFSRDFSLCDQIRRSTISVISNIAEGHERESQKEYAMFLGYAKGSVGEVRGQLYVALDLGYISEAQFKEAMELCVSVSKQLKGFINYLRQEED